MVQAAEGGTMTSAYRLEVVRTRLREPVCAVNSSAETASRYAQLDKYDRERLIRMDVDSQNRVIGEDGRYWSSGSGEGKVIRTPPSKKTVFGGGKHGRARWIRAVGCGDAEA
jgi:hypothetical protein